MVSHDKVIVRADLDRPLVRFVWGAVGQTVYVTDEATIRRLEAGEDGPLPIGFPRADVFRYDAEAERRIGTHSWNWSGLAPYQ